jgi:general L-amino acid transport system permease protein
VERRRPAIRTANPLKPETESSHTVRALFHIQLFKHMTAQAPETLSSRPAPIAGGFGLLYSPKFRGIVSQVVVVLLLLWGLYEVIGNTQANLKKLNQNFGFDFLTQAAGFDLSTSLISYTSSSTYGRAIFVGLLNTILVAVLGIFFSTIIGFIVGVMRLSKNKVVAGAATIYIEFIRNVPLLLQIFMWYALVLKPLPGVKGAITLFGTIFISNRGITMPHPNFGPGAWVALPFLVAGLAGTWLFRRQARKRQEATGQVTPAWLISIPIIVLSPILGLLAAGWPLSFDIPVLKGFNFSGGMSILPEMAALLIALTIYSATFIAETVRSGIQAVSHGQSEASSALGLSRGMALRLVVIPQAMRVIIPPLASQYLNLTKNSSLAIAIGFPDLMYAGGTVNNQSGKAIEVVFILMVVYLSLSLMTALFMNWFNSRVKLVER